MIEVVVKKRQTEADNIVSFELARIDNSPLPKASPGSHIDVHLAQNLIRQYSLYEDSSKTNSYKIAVLKDPNSRGGSEAIHADLQEGHRIQISEPRNLFELANDAPAYVLVAGGIGITPILSMAEHLASQRANFSLHYFARCEEKAAFLQHLKQSHFSDKVHFCFDGDAPDAFMNTLQHAGPDSQLYVCGPNGFMDFVFKSAGEYGWTDDRLHKEHFAAETSHNAPNGTFSVEIASTGQVFHIPEDLSVFEVLDDAGIEVNVSCEQGICGSCLTKVISGVPDHRDQFQSKAEQAKNEYFTPCCSRSFSEKLVIDL